MPSRFESHDLGPGGPPGGGRVVLSYQGAFSDTIVEHLTGLLEAALTEVSLDRTTRTRLKALLVEQVQNIQRYSSQARSGEVRIAQGAFGLSVETVNAIEARWRPDLERQLTVAGSHSAEGLQALFRRAMHAPLRAGKTSAGLGLLLLARESSRPLVFTFEPRADHDLDFRLTSFV